MARDLAAEHGVRLTHAALDERMADAVHQRLAAVRRNDVLDRVARAQIVDDRRARLFQQERLCEKRRDEVAGNEFARAVDEEAAVGVAVPRDADVRLLPDHFRDDVAAVFFDQRIGFVVREVAVDLKTQPGRQARQLIEHPGRGNGGRPAAGIEDHFERFDDRRVDERHDVPDVLMKRIAVRHVAALVRRLGQVASGNHVANVVDAGLAAQGKRAFTHQLHAVVLLRVV